MDPTIENFLGHVISVPQDRLYEPSEGLWVKERADGRLAVGLTEPGILMTGPVREVELLVEDGDRVERGSTVVLALTGKLKYLAAPVSGNLIYPEQTDRTVSHINENPYDSPLFYMVPDGRHASGLTNAEAYVEALKDSEGVRNPKGHKGGVSPTCKAVYMGIGEQNLRDGS